MLSFPYRVLKAYLREENVHDGGLNMLGSPV
jgi:hypothetical protein